MTRGWTWPSLHDCCHAPAASGSSGAEVIGGVVFLSFPLHHTLTPASRMASTPCISGCEHRGQTTAPSWIRPSVPFHCYLSHDFCRWPTPASWQMLLGQEGCSVLRHGTAPFPLPKHPAPSHCPFQGGEQSPPAQGRQGTGMGSGAHTSEYANLHLAADQKPCQGLHQPRPSSGPAPSVPSKANKAKGSVVSDP